MTDVTARADVTTRDGHFIDGGWARPASTGTIPVENPATERIIGHVPDGTAADVDAAVAAARAAFPGWAATSVEERAKWLSRLTDALAARRDQVAETITAEMGTPASIAAQVQAGMPIGVLTSYAGLLTSYPWVEELGTSQVVREPVGVVGAITPWNYPLHQVVAKVAPALGAGCTVVLKPSEVAPLCSYLLAEIVEEVGLPPGVFNLVAGTGPVVGEAIASHPDVDMVSFTGSTRAGTRVSALAASTVKKVALELGGKSANVLLPDADLATAVPAGVGNAFLNAGQTCTAWTRMLVPAARQHEAVDLAVVAAESYGPGDPTVEATRMGPLASGAQRQRVRGYIDAGVAEGARLVTGGGEAPDDLETGHYVRPTVFADVDSSMTIAQEEIFGPVLSILPYNDVDDAVRIANDTRYGLAGAVWGGQEQATAVARRMRTGQVTVNGGKFNVLAPFGGYRQSGLGRELGEHGLAEFCEVKSIHH